MINMLIAVGLVMLLGILVMLFLAFSMMVKMDKKYKTPSEVIPMVEFEKDIIFLHFIIETKLNDTKKFVITPKRITDRWYISDDEIKKLNEELTNNIIISLSPMYKMILSKYFTDDSLIEYISARLFRELVNYAVKNNVV